MPQAGQVIEGPDGFRLDLIRTGDETGGEVLVMEAHYSGDSPMPPAHLHPAQDERFTILEGSVLMTVDGEERRYDDGDTFDVPAGAVHQLFADEPARVHWEVRPAMRTAEFFERLYGDGPDAARNAPSITDFLDEFSAEIRFPQQP